MASETDNAYRAVEPNGHELPPAGAKSAPEGGTGDRCPRDSDWCDGKICQERGIDCPYADPRKSLADGVRGFPPAPVRPTRVSVEGDRVLLAREEGSVELTAIPADVEEAEVGGYVQDWIGAANGMGC